MSLREKARELVAEGQRSYRRCDFCGKRQREVRVLIGSTTGPCICDECVALCVVILAQIS